MKIVLIVKHYLVCDFLAVLFEVVNLVHHDVLVPRPLTVCVLCFVFVSRFDDMFLARQVVGVAVAAVAVVIRITIIILFLDIFLIFILRIDGLLTAEFAALLSTFDRLFGRVIEYVNGYLFPVLAATHINGLFKEIFTSVIDVYFVTVCGLFTAIGAAVLANFNCLINELCGPRDDKIISTITSGFVHCSNKYCNGFIFEINTTLSATNIMATVGGNGFVIMNSSSHKSSKIPLNMKLQNDYPVQQIIMLNIDKPPSNRQL